MEQTRQGKAGRKPRRKRIKADTYDFGLFFVVLTLVLFGVVMIFSASYYDTMSSQGDMFYYLKRQGVWAILGTIGMVVAMNVPYQLWKKLSFPLYMISNFLLMILPVIGKNAKGQVRWIQLGPLQFQPSEFTKIAVILYLSCYVLNHRKELGNLKGFAKAAGILAIPVVLIAMSNFSSALLLLLVGTTILFIASPKIWYFVAGIGALIPFAAIMVILPQFRYRLTRITTWLDPWSDLQGSGYQTVQSLYAVASGGLFGLGLGQSRQKTFIPEAHNDIIFAIICEELGLVGAALVIILFAVVVWRGIRIAMNARDNYGMLVATGITSVIAFQSLINIGVVTNTIPNTGQPLPFISYGGTALLVAMGMMGILLNISKYPKDMKNTE
ncbi:putative lipid II flippase FtsW [Anaerotignum sp.]|uniref:putative lipid II flippase FtsW n=1 Tax=Anaerotignum sp. TaxID=2039241 RepID=UPI002A920E44|nr:putative lipid II flippase FtsW [Anaerotignum sp.]MCI7657094.1 putative lipid II flippase FtsW [Clostridia bacterium]MDY5414931.1 putative lipid II flippase FtsW [Anaerotignum sp.]